MIFRVGVSVFVVGKSRKRRSEVRVCSILRNSRCSAPRIQTCRGDKETNCVTNCSLYPPNFDGSARNRALDGSDTGHGRCFCVVHAYVRRKSFENIYVYHVHGICTSHNAWVCATRTATLPPSGTTRTRASYFDGF